MRIVIALSMIVALCCSVTEAEKHTHLTLDYQRELPAKQSLQQLCEAIAEQWIGAQFLHKIYFVAAANTTITVRRNDKVILDRWRCESKQKFCWQLHKRKSQLLLQGNDRQQKLLPLFAPQKKKHQLIIEITPAKAHVTQIEYILPKAFAAFPALLKYMRRQQQTIGELQSQSIQQKQQSSQKHQQLQQQIAELQKQLQLLTRQQQDHRHTTAELQKKIAQQQQQLQNMTATMREQHQQHAKWQREVLQAIASNSLAQIAEDGVLQGCQARITEWGLLEISPGIVLITGKKRTIIKAQTHFPSQLVQMAKNLPQPSTNSEHCFAVALTASLGLDVEHLGTAELLDDKEKLQETLSSTKSTKQKSSIAVAIVTMIYNGGDQANWGTLKLAEAPGIPVVAKIK